MFDPVVDLLYWFFFIIYAGLFQILDVIYEIIIWFPQHLNEFLHNSLILDLMSTFSIIGFSVFGVLYILSIITSIFEGLQGFQKFFKRIFAMSILLLSITYIFDMGTNFTVALTNAVPDMFVQDTNESENNTIGTALVNSMIYPNPDMVESGIFNVCPDGTTKENAVEDECYFEQGSIITAENTSYSINYIAQRYKTTDFNDNNYVYKYVNPIIALVVALGAIILMAIAGIKLVGQVFKILTLQVVSPFVIMFKGSFMENTTKAFLVEVWKAFLGIFFQVFFIYFSLSMITIMLTTVGSPTFGVGVTFEVYGKLILDLFILFGGLLLILDGSDIVVSLFGIDTGSTSTFQTYASMKAIQEGVGDIVKGIDKMSFGESQIPSSTEDVVNSTDDFKQELLGNEVGNFPLPENDENISSMATVEKPLMENGYPAGNNDLDDENMTAEHKGGINQQETVVNGDDYSSDVNALGVDNINEEYNSDVNALGLDNINDDYNSDVNTLGVDNINEEYNSDVNALGLDNINDDRGRKDIDSYEINDKENGNRRFDSGTYNINSRLDTQNKDSNNFSDVENIIFDRKNPFESEE